MAAAGTASPAQRRRSDSVRPLSSTQLVSKAADSVSDGGGVENSAFELGDSSGGGTAERGGKFSYRQALSSLLWEPYDCRESAGSPAGALRSRCSPCCCSVCSSMLVSAGEHCALVPDALTVIVRNVQEETPRTFTSTEAQTDDLPTRDQRRRERRERRHQRRLHSAAGSHVHELPDILNSHLPPPYTTLGPPPTVPLPPPPVPVPVSPASPPPAMRFPFQLTPTGRRRARGQPYSPEEEPKSCCGLMVTQTVSIRWFILMIAFVGIGCAVVGTVLGAMKASGREHLTVSLLMIGVGIVLITVSGVAWRLTAHDAPSCRTMLGLSSAEESAAEPNRRFVPRLPPSYGRPHHPYAAMMYPEFQYRPPPPSYQASMQEYRLRLLLLDRHGSSPGQAASPPPTYRSHAGSTISRVTLGLRRDALQSNYSRPPSYRSRTSSTRPMSDPNGITGCSTTEHSRNPSLSPSESGGGSAVVNVISVMGNSGSESETLDDIKIVPDQDMPLRLMLKKGNHSTSTVNGAKDGNLVTIVQTDNGTSPVIVTVSGSTMATTASGTGVDPEMEILAHL